MFDVRVILMITLMSINNQSNSKGLVLHSTIYLVFLFIHISIY